ncbi:MAG: bacillithiol biosynthesis cysteine-adding enzyme BshC [Terriglobia bacterium]
MKAQMDCHGISHKRVPHSSKLLLDYLDDFARVRDFYGSGPFDPAGYRTLAAKLEGFHTHRAAIVEILNRQNRIFGSGEAAFENIRRLGEAGTFAVVTGQQVGLLSGPAFTLYKALTAVKLAQSLSLQGLPCVPVFWLATQDHDLAEVAQIATFDDEYNLVPLHDPGERPAPRSPVGYVKLTENIEVALGDLEKALPPGEPRERLLRDLRDCYQPGVTWSLAFARWMARLFRPCGVILLDPLDQEVESVTHPVFARALEESEALRSRLLARSRALEAAGYHAQVRVTDESTLVFVMRDGNRLPLQQRAGDFFLDGTEHVSLKELRAGAGQGRFHFSANALLRPVVQDLLLPTLAYVAGPSELAYLGQSQTLYESFGRPQPIIFPRAGFTLVDRRIQRLLEKYKLEVEDVWESEEHLRQKIAAAGLSEGWAERFDRSETELAALLERMRGDIETLDPTLLDTLKHAQEKMRYQLEKLKGKLSRAALQRSELLSRHEQALRKSLNPERDLQERRVGGVSFLGRAGYELLDRILAQIHTQSSDHQVFVY